MSKTPETDAAIQMAAGGAIYDAAGGVIDAVTHEEAVISRLMNLARSLESRLAEAREEIARLKERIKELTGEEE